MYLSSTQIRLSGELEGHSQLVTSAPHHPEAPTFRITLRKMLSRRFLLNQTPWERSRPCEGGIPEHLSWRGPMGITQLGRGGSCPLGHRMPETDESWVRNGGRVLQQVRDQDCWVGRHQGVWQTPGAPQPMDSEVRAGRDSGGSLSHLPHGGPG